MTVQVAAPLETPRLVLRPCGDHDVSLLCAGLRANAARLGRTGDETLTRTATWITAERAAWEHGERYALLVLARGVPRPTLWGQITLSVRGQTAALGFWVDAAVEGRGIAHEALTAVLAFAFGPLGLTRLEAAVLPENQRSLSLLERLGFRHEGLARGKVAVDGGRTDHLLFVRLQGDR